MCPPPCAWGWAGGRQRAGGSRLRQPTQASPVAAPAPTYALSSPGGAELSNSNYAAWPVYLGVSGQGHPPGGGPPHLQGHRNRERKRDWAEGARQTPNYHDNSFCLSAPGWDPSTSAKHLSQGFPHISSVKPRNNPKKRVHLLFPCSRRGHQSRSYCTMTPTRAFWFQLLLGPSEANVIVPI